MSKQTIIIIGCGIHYREKYHAVLEKRGVEIALLVDLKANKEIIRAFFEGRQLQPKHFLFLDNAYRNTLSVEQIEAWVAGLDLSRVDGVLISTEPKVRKPYVIWAAQHGWDLFMDKPVTAFSSLDQISILESDTEEMISAVHKHQVRAVVSCERRAHLGYVWLKNYMNQLILQEQAPLTGIDIHFSGGVWKTPSEYLHDENHPFSYGYGILLHSGYHYIDLLVCLLALNDPLFPLTKYSLSTMASKPFEGSGETDFLMIGQAFSQTTVKTLFSVKLFGTSVSTRRSKETNAKLEGRVRQEKITLHFGHLSSIHLSSIAYKKLIPQEIEDFTITVMSSPILKKQHPLITLDRKDFSQIFLQLPLTASMNTFARQWQLEEFLEGRDGNSPLSSHRNTVAMLQRIYQTL